MVGHVDEPVDPEIPFPDGGLVGGQVAVDDEQVGSGANGIGDEPFEAAGGIAKVAVFVEVGVASVTNPERHGKLPVIPLSLSLSYERLFVGSGWIDSSGFGPH